VRIYGTNTYDYDPPSTEKIPLDSLPVEVKCGSGRKQWNIPNPTILNATRINFRDRFLPFFLDRTQSLKMQYATFASTQLSPVKRLWMTQGWKVHKSYAAEDLTDWKFGKWRPNTHGKRKVRCLEEEALCRKGGAESL
jgi:hypothetical protein